MIVIQRRNDHTSPFFGGRPSFHRHGFRGPHHFHGPHFHGPHRFGGYVENPMMAPHNRPSPSFYSSPFDQVEEAMMSPYRPPPRPRPHPFFLRHNRHRRFGPDMLGPVVILARREDQSEAEKEAHSIPENEKRQADSVTENKAEESAKPEPSDKASEQSAENDESPKETPTSEESKNKEDEKAEEDMRRALMHIFGPDRVRRSLRGGCRSRNADGGCKRSSAIADMSVDRTDEDVTIKVNVDGYDAPGLSVEYAEGFLSISGERVNEDTGFHSKFVRRVPLNDRRMDVENVSARLIDGVLNICVPRRAGASSRSIEIVSDDKKSAESNPVKAQFSEPQVVSKDFKSTFSTSDVDVDVDADADADADVVGSDKADGAETGEVGSAKDQANEDVISGSTARDQNVCADAGNVAGLNDASDAVTVAGVETDEKETKTDEADSAEDKNKDAVPESTTQSQNDNESVSSVSNVSLKDLVSVKTISSDDEDDDGEETYEMV